MITHPVEGLVPRPLTARAAPGHAVLGEDAVVVADPALRAAALRWRRVAEDAFGLAWDLRERPRTDPGADTVFRLDPDLPAGGYTLEVDGSVTVTAADAAGAHAAVATVVQLLGPVAYRRAVAARGPVAVPCCRVVDAPRWGWRGVLLDVARHFLPKDGVLRFVELAAAHKLNVVQLHLTDDQGWRMEVRAFPRLTDVGAWRTGSTVGTWQEGRPDPTPHGGFYTHDDLREIVAFAAARGVTVVPEIDVPGHSQAAVAAYPELGLPGAATTVGTTWGITEAVLAPSEETVRFYCAVLDEVCAVFDSPVVHVGGDEVPLRPWRSDPATVARAAELGLADVGELHGWFVGRLATHLAGKGRRAAVWDEALGPALPPGTVVTAWTSAARAGAALAAGHDAVLAPEESVYLDHRTGAGPDEPVPVGYLRSVEDVYGFAPTDPEPAGPGRLLGAQAAVWTEHLDSGRRVDFATHPRLAAFAETAWTAPDRRDLAGFRRRLTEHHLPRLAAAGVEFRPEAGPLPWQRRPGVPGRPRELPPAADGGS